MKNLILFIIGPYEKIMILLIYVYLMVDGIYLTLKGEKGIAKILWIIFIISVPFLGGLISIINFRINKANLAKNENLE